MIPAAEPDESGPSARHNAWMITFVDLISLMLTFLVMLYAMSDPRPVVPPRHTVDTLAETVDWLERELPARAARHGADSVQAAPAADLDYLHGVLQAALAGEPVRPTLARRDDRLVIALPPPAAKAARRGHGSEPVLGEAETRVLHTLGRLLNGIDNRLEVHGIASAPPPRAERPPATTRPLPGGAVTATPADAGPASSWPEAAWESAITQARAAAAALAAGGLQRPVGCYGLADLPANRLRVETGDRRQPPASRIHIVVLAGAGE